MVSLSSTQKNLFKNTLEIRVYSAKSPKITTERTNIRSERKARISGLAGTEHARNRTLLDLTFPVTVWDLGTRLHNNRKRQYHQSSSPRAIHNLSRLESRLGCLLPEPNRKWSLVSSGIQRSYQSCRTQSSFSCHRNFSQTPFQHHCVSPHGQYHSRCPHKQYAFKTNFWSPLSTYQANSTMRQTESQESLTTPANGK